MKNLFRILACCSMLLIAVSPVTAETCSTAAEMDAATKSSLQSAARTYYQYVSQGNAQGLASNAIADIASNVAGVQGLLQEHQPSLAGSTGTPRNTYLLEAGGSAPIERAEFYCGVFNSPAKAGFTLNNLPAGKYGLVIMDVSGSKTPYFYSFLLKEERGSWKVAGLFPRPRQVVGNDAQYYWQQARDFKTKGQRFNAWLSYLIARELASPLPFMSTVKLDSFYDEIQSSQPQEFPGQRPLPLAAANGKTYQVTELFVVPNEKDRKLDLVMKYQTNDISNTGQTFIENKEAMKALLARYPELKEPFTNLVARAVAPSGQDFGSMLPIKDVK
ncbi:MAG TPA: hypothetical protein VM056_05960 [Terriglobales bacterium]|nr:hypothetical protein [Terriglobales bacterium]